MGLAIILGIIGFIAGAVVIYKVMQQKLEEQKQIYLEQSHQLREGLEKNHEFRLKETIQSLQADHNNQLKELEATYESRIQETIKNLEQKNEINLNQDHPLLNSEQDSENLESKLPIPVEEEKVSVISLAELSDDSVTVAVTENIVPVEEQVTNSSLEITESTTVLSNLIPKPPEITAQKVTVSSKLPGSKNQALAQTIVSWGKTGEGRYINQLTELIYHPDSYIRAQVASALGEIAASKNITTDIQKVIPTLGKLMQDSEVLVRQSTVEALGKIKSAKVIPLLQKGLRDPDSKVVKYANDGLSKAKFYRLNKEAKSGQKQSKKIKR